MNCAIITINSDVFEGNRYLFYLVNKVKEIVDDLVICISTNAENALIDELRKYSSRIFQYETYIDIVRWSSCIIDCKLEQDYENLLLLNDSVFGPIVSLESFLGEALRSEAQFYGMTRHGGMKIGRREYSPFVQTYCFVLKTKLLHDQRFNTYLQSMTKVTSPKDADSLFEFSFSDQVLNWGYTWDVFFDTKYLENENKEYYESFIIFDTYNLLKRGFPFLPKILFDINKSSELSYNRGDVAKKCMEYIKGYTEYDVNLIYDNLIKRKDPAELIEHLNLYKIVPEQRDNLHTAKKRAVFAFLFYDDLMEKSVEYLLNLPNEIDVYIATDKEEKKEYIEKLFQGKSSKKIFLELHQNNGRDLAALLVLFRPYLLQYDTICFIHDKKSNQMLFPSVGADFNNQMWDCMLKNQYYIINMLNWFEQEERIGIIVPPMVSHGMYFNTLIDAWTICFERTVCLKEKLGVNSPISRECNPATLGSVFWAKTAALRKLFEYEWKYSDFPQEPMPVDGSISHCIERIFSYVASDAGFLTAFVMDTDTASNEIVNGKETTHRLLKQIDRMHGIDTATLFTTIESFKQAKIKKKRKRKRHIL